MATSPRRPQQRSGRLLRAGAAVTDSHRQRSLVAGRHLLPERAAVAGRSAALLYGVRLVRDDDAPVEVVTPWDARFGPVRGLTVHVGELPDADVRTRHGVRVTTPLRTGWDLAQWLPLPDAVACLDALALHRVVRLPALERYAGRRAGLRGWQRLSRAVALADPAAESMWESRLRVRLVLAGLPKPVSRYAIGSDGGVTSRVDLAWPQQRVGVACDGQPPDGAARAYADRTRLNRLFTTDGWIILHVTAARLREDFDGFVAEVRARLRSP
jgi:hypothetical protein